jgi:hypothetical protein
MDHLRTLVALFREQHPTLKAKEEVFVHLETTFLPHLLRVLQKDNTLLAEVDLFPGIRVAWEGTDAQWKALHMGLLHSVLHGNPKEKFGAVLESFKGLVPGLGGGATTKSEIESILDDESTQGALSEMMELIMGTRLVSLVGDIIQNLSFETLGLDLENPESILEMLRNPQGHAGLNEIMERAKTILEDRVNTGKINPVELRRDIEMIRAKFQSAFGKYLNEAIVGDAGGGTTGNTAQQILSNHPDARRARMLARLQKKQKVRASK